MDKREIKFRAWDGSKMLQWDSSVKLFSFYIIEWENYHFMQFTELFDKNGVEIYEGDIVLADGMESVLEKDMSNARKFVSNSISDIRRFAERRSAYEVYWQNNFSQFSFMSLSNPKHSINSDVSNRNLEIIGNIYQNPSLTQPR